MEELVYRALTLDPRGGGDIGKSLVTAAPPDRPAHGLRAVWVFSGPRWNTPFRFLKKYYFSDNAFMYFPQHFIKKNLKLKEKLKECYSKHLNTYLLDAQFFLFC